MFCRLVVAESESKEKQGLLVDAEDHIRQLQHENELIEAKNKSLLAQLQDNSISYGLVSCKHYWSCCIIKDTSYNGDI